MIIFLIFISFAYLSVRIKLRSIRTELKYKINTRLSLYLMAFIASQIPAFVNRGLFFKKRKFITYF